MAITPHAQYFRHRLYPRLRHQRHLSAFIAAEATALNATPAVQTVTPKRTVNTKAETLVVFATNPANADTLTIGNFTYKFVTALTEVKATGTLTNDGSNVTAADTVTIDGHVYTFKASVTEVKATGTLTNDGSNVTDGDTVTIGSKVYTFQNTLTNVDGHVKIGASNTATMTNLFHAINASGGTVGTDYATLTVANLQVVATNPTGTTVVLTAIAVGTAANSIATTEASTHLAFGNVTLTGGVAAVANEVKVGASNTASMTNLFHAINASGGTAGTDYSSNTVAHATVDATNPTGTTVVVTAKTAGIAANSIAITEASTHLAWGAAILTGGVAAIANQIPIQDTAAHTRDKVVLATGATGVAGTDYSTGTVVHDKVIGSASGGDLLLTALSAGTPGLSVRLAKSSSHLTLPTLAQLDGPLWTATGHGFVNGNGPVRLTNSGGALPAGSVTSDLYVHVVDANTIALATSLESMRKGNFIATTNAGSGTQSVTRSVTAAGIFGLFGRNKPRTVAAASDVDALK